MKAYKSKFHEWEFTSYYIQTEADAKKAIAKLDPSKLCGLDIETAKNPKFKDHPSAGLCPHLSHVRLIQVYDGVKNVYVFDLFSVDLGLLESFIANGRFVAHNGIFEIQSLRYYGFDKLNIGCSMLLSQLVDGAEHSPFESEEEEDEGDQDQTGLAAYKRKRHTLDAVIQRLYGVKVDKSQQVSDWSKPQLDTEQITYAALDAVLTYHAAVKLAPKIADYGMQKAYALLKDAQHVVADMHLTGMPVDWEYHTQLRATWKTKCDAALLECKPYFGETNMRSSKQMGEWLEKYLKDDPITLAGWPKTKKKKLAFGKALIARYTKLPAIAALLNYKKWAKLLDTYGETLAEKRHPVTDRLHTSYTLGETRTGRLSSRSPNIQNGPREVEFRNIFCAPKDHVIVVSDFNAIELRVQAEFSKDPVMCKVYKEKGDIYKTMASHLYGLPVEKIDKDKRFVGKTVMLALGYGMGPPKLESKGVEAGMKNSTPFYQKAHKTYHTTFKTYSLWCDKMRQRATKLGYIETLLGKRRKLTKDELYTRAPNHVIQGSSAELMLKALLICQDRIKGVGEIIATIHDEVLLVVHKSVADKAASILASSMNDAMKELFPNAVSHEVAEAAYAQRWGEAKAEL